MGSIWEQWPFRLSPSRSYRSMVFPLGMYTAAPFRLAMALGLPVLLSIPKIFFVAALATWALTLFGLVTRSWRFLAS